MIKWLHPRLDLPLDKDADAGFLLWIIALMVYLTALTVTGSGILESLAERWNRELSGSLTLELDPVAAGSASMAGPAIAQARLESALRILSQESAIAHLRPINDDEVADLLEPWLGEGIPVEYLPLPKLVDIRLKPGKTVNLDHLRRQLESVEGARLDTHGLWLADLRRMAAAIELVAAGILLVISVTAVVAVAAASSARLQLHEKAVRLLHLIGASDAYIARQFQWQSLLIALRGSVIGLGLALATMFLVSVAAGKVATNLLPDYEVSSLTRAVIMLLPVTAMLLTALTARLTVLFSLRRMP